MSHVFVTLEGNLTGDIQYRQGQNGQFATVGLAVNHRKKDPQGSWVNAGTSFYNLAINNTQLLAGLQRSPSIAKGVPVVVSGSLKLSSYTDQQGMSHTSANVNVDSLGVSPVFTSIQVAKAVSAPVQPQSQSTPVQTQSAFAQPVQAQGTPAPVQAQPAPAPAQPQPVQAQSAPAPAPVADIDNWFE